jgi:hypothetical protein
VFSLAVSRPGVVITQGVLNDKKASGLNLRLELCVLRDHYSIADSL